MRETQKTNREARWSRALKATTQTLHATQMPSTQARHVAALTTGSATLQPQLNGPTRHRLRLEDAHNIVFTRIVFRHLKFYKKDLNDSSRDDFPLELVRCSNITIRSLVVDDIQVQSKLQQVLRITNSSGVRVESGSVYRLGVVNVGDTGSGSLLDVSNSHVALSSLSVTDGHVSDKAAVLLAGNSSFAAVNVNWTNIATGSRPVIDASGAPGVVSLADCQFSNLTALAKTQTPSVVAVFRDLAPATPSSVQPGEAAAGLGTSVTISGCSFRDIGSSDGSVVTPVLTGQHAYLQLTDTTISNAGGIFLDASNTTAPTTVSRSSFTNTQGGYVFGTQRFESGGALAVYNGGGLTISHSTFTNCSAPGDGGAIYTQQQNAPTTLALVNCTFESTHARNGSGGAVALSGSSIAVRDSRFLGGSATGYGGAVVLLTPATSSSCGVESQQVPQTAAPFAATVTGSTFNSNTARIMGGAIFVSWPHPTGTRKHACHWGHAFAPSLGEVGTLQ